jgi:hypothetical protein
VLSLEVQICLELSGDATKGHGQFDCVGWYCVYCMVLLEAVACVKDAHVCNSGPNRQQLITQSHRIYWTKKEEMVGCDLFVSLADIAHSLIGN